MIDAHFENDSYYVVSVWLFYLHATEDKMFASFQERAIKTSVTVHVTQVVKSSGLAVRTTIEQGPWNNQIDWNVGPAKFCYKNPVIYFYLFVLQRKDKRNMVILLDVKNF